METKFWYVDDGDVEVGYDANSALEAAQQYVAEGDYDTSGGTTWAHVLVWEEGDNDGPGESFTIAVHPPAPTCKDDQEHNWTRPHEVVGGLADNPGVWGHGGGVIIQEVCSHCGCGRRTDTWAQDRETGAQGLESVEYQPDFAAAGE